MSYFIRIRGKVFGPFDDTQLATMKTNGKLGRNTEVSDNKVDWQPAESVLSDLFPPSTPSGSRQDFSSSAGSTVYGAQTTAQPADWFYSVNGTEGFGPVTAATIEQMLQTGQLIVQSYVWQQGQNARHIKNEPRFYNPIDGGASLPSVEKSRDIANLGGEITGISEEVNTSQMLRPIAASLGWLMFLKITFLMLGVIAQGLYLLWASVFLISQAIRADNVAALLAAMIIIILWVGLYALQFKTFLCFWKYHTDLYQTVATGRTSDLTQANHSLFLFWKWLSITAISYLAVTIVGVTVMIIASGWFLSIADRIFQ